MNYKQYIVELREYAVANGYGKDQIDSLITYTKKLNENNLPIIFDVDHLSLLMGIEKNYLYKASNSQKLFYSKFTINKRSGGKRIIYEPLPTLKNAQKWIAKEILEHLKCSPFSKAYKKETSIKNNARFHVNQNTVICLDIKDYFGAIKEYDVYKFFLDNGYAPEISGMLSKLCCLKGALPQGAPTSPSLSNLITVDLDQDLANLSKKYSTSGMTVRYTRYADDITLSGNNLIAKEILPQITKILIKHGFTINQKKTRILGKNSRQIVTGVVVNKKVQASSNKRRKIRQSVYYINKFGLSEHLKHINLDIDELSYIDGLLGQINFVLFLNKSDEEFKKYKMEMENLRINYT